MLFAADVALVGQAGLQPIIDVTRPFFQKASVLLGGIFGLYFILILTRVYYERKKVILLTDIRYDLDRLNMFHNISFSRQRRSIFRRLGARIVKLFKFKVEPPAHLNEHKKRKNK